MKALRTLLRVARRDLDVLRRALADQISKQMAVEERIRAGAQDLADEQGAAQRDFESHRAFAIYAPVVRAAQRALEGERAAIDQECDRMRALIAEAHVEMRKFERLIELDEARQRAALEKRDAAELDELATQRAGRMRAP